MTPEPNIADLIQQAAAQRKAGEWAEARRLIEEALRAEPENARALNALGLVLLDMGQVKDAVSIFGRVCEIDPASPALWINLAQAHYRAGDRVGQIAALDHAIAIDPYLVPAIAQKTEALEALGRAVEALPLYSALVKIVPADQPLPPALQAVLDRGRARLKLAADNRANLLAADVDGVRKAYPASALTRANAFADIHFGRRRVYHPEPTGFEFPFLPNDEYFDRKWFPWFDRLEAATADIRAELAALLPARAGMFEPYVQFPPGVPLNQWSELQNSSQWDSYFLWKDGQPNPEGIARCPKTAALMRELPLLDLAGRGPTVMFSLLAPKTTIPPHSGTTNIRSTVHLPLIVPEGCWFRVGGETRIWREGEAWAFDDTIEHEARNDSDQLRSILIIDVWNPYLTEAERAMVRALGG